MIRPCRSDVVASNISKTRAFRGGKIAIQDEASQLVALLVGKGKNILDCCAAPGGKTRIMAAQNPHSAVLALELHPQRAALLRKLVPATNVNVTTTDARDFAVTKAFDRVLADVPCSGTGTLSRNPEIKWRLTPNDLADLTSRQSALLDRALDALAPGGLLVYSTCSLETEENEGVISRVPERRIVQKMQRLPGRDAGDGFFASVIKSD